MSEVVSSKKKRQYGRGNVMCHFRFTSLASENCAKIELAGGSEIHAKLLIHSFLIVYRLELKSKPRLGAFYFPARVMSFPTCHCQIIIPCTRLDL